jgi:hypothetical protein
MQPVQKKALVVAIEKCRSCAEEPVFIALQRDGVHAGKAERRAERGRPGEVEVRELRGHSERSEERDAVGRGEGWEAAMRKGRQRGEAGS